MSLSLNSCGTQFLSFWIIPIAFKRLLTVDSSTFNVSDNLWASNKRWLAAADFLRLKRKVMLPANALFLIQNSTFLCDKKLCSLHPINIILIIKAYIDSTFIYISTFGHIEIAQRLTSPGQQRKLIHLIIYIG